MRNSKATMAVIAAAALAASVTSAAGQACVDRAGEGSSNTRDNAMRAAYEAVLRAVDPGLLRAWTERSQKIGEAPGYQVSKLAAKCQPTGAGQTCRIQGTFCN